MPGLWDPVTAKPESQPARSPAPAARSQPEPIPLASPLEAPELWEPMSGDPGAGSPLDSSYGTPLPSIGRSSGSSNRLLYLLMGLAGGVAALVLLFIVIRIAMGPSTPEKEVAQGPPVTMPGATPPGSGSPVFTQPPVTPGTSPTWPTTPPPGFGPGPQPNPNFPTFPASPGPSPPAYPQDSSTWPPPQGSDWSPTSPFNNPTFNGLSSSGKVGYVIGMIIGFVVAMLVGGLITAGLFQLACLICRELNMTYGEAYLVQLGIMFVSWLVNLGIGLALNFAVGPNVAGILANVCSFIVYASLAVPVYMKRLDTSFGKALLVFIVHVVLQFVLFCIFAVVIGVLLAAVLAAARG